MAMLQDKAFRQRMTRIEGLIGELDRLSDPSARSTAEALVQAIMDLHGSGLERMLDLTWEKGAAGQALIDNLAKDELLGSLLLLHGLHPLDLETRVSLALEQVRPYLASHGGDVELLDTSDGVIRLKLQGSCHGCPSSAMTLRNAIESALAEAAPDLVALEVEGVVEATSPAAPPSGFIALDELVCPAPLQAIGANEVLA